MFLFPIIIAIPSPPFVDPGVAAVLVVAFPIRGWDDAHVREVLTGVLGLLCAGISLVVTNEIIHSLCPIALPFASAVAGGLTELGLLLKLAGEMLGDELKRGRDVVVAVAATTTGRT